MIFVNKNRYFIQYFSYRYIIFRRNESYTFSAFQHIRCVSCIEIQPYRAVISYKMAGINKLCHPIRVSVCSGLDKDFAEREMKSVGGRQQKNCGMAFAGSFVNAVLYSDVTVGEFVYFKTSAAEVEIWVLFVGFYYRRVRHRVPVARIFREIDVRRLTEAAVLDKSQSARIVKSA